MRRHLPCFPGISLASLLLYSACIPAGAQSQPQSQPQSQAQPDATLGEVVVSASRNEQRRFDAPAAIDAVQVDTMRTGSPLVNLSELMSAVPGVQVRERQNYAQDLQLSVRGFGTRSTFGVRGVRILVDGIPATMPDGQGQLSSISLTSAKRIELLRGPLAQLYGNAAGGVLQVFTQDPPVSAAPRFAAGIGAGSDHQRQVDLSIGGGSETLGALLDVSRYSTDGYRNHSAAERTQVNAKLVARPSSSTTVTGVFNLLDQPLSQDPLGLPRPAFLNSPRSVVPAAIQFDTRKTVNQKQAGVVLDHDISASDRISARLYGGTREVFQTLGMSGAAATSSGGVVDLDRSYGGAGVSWTHKTRAGGMPLQWTVGVEADRLQETRRGFVNNTGTPGDLRRYEDDNASNMDVFGQLSWTFAPQWEALAGVRASRVKFNVGDHYLADGRNDSGSTSYHNTSPVLGTIWHANDNLNVYGNIGTGFETPTLAEIAYRAGGTGPNLQLQASKSLQAEVGVKARFQRHTVDLALFEARSRDEIVPQSNNNGRTVYQNADRVERRGFEAGWKADWNTDWKPITTHVAYTLLDARFRSSYSSGAVIVPSGNRLPGAPVNSLFADVEARVGEGATVALETRIESRIQVNDVNSDAAPGYAVFHLRAGKEVQAGPAKVYVYGRIDNLFDRQYAGSVIVNEANSRFFEPAPGRRLFVGVRSQF
jgi:iron complex outermembrane receptor protein